MGRVDGKVALITGAASGLGLEDARVLAAEGAKVVITDISAEKGAAAAEEIGDAATFLKHDVSSEDDWKRVIADVERAHGRLDILVNNAGVVVLSTPESCTLEEFRFANGVMSEGVFLGCKYALPLLRKSQDGASIINMSSTASHVGYPIFFAYSAAKGAVRAMTKSIAMHCQGENYPVRCNSIHAGAIETPMVQLAQGRAGEDPQTIPKGVLPAGALGAPRDIANLVLYLASDESRFVTGAEFVIDNGLIARPAG